MSGGPMHSRWDGGGRAICGDQGYISMAEGIGMGLRRGSVREAISDVEACAVLAAKEASEAAAEGVAVAGNSKDPKISGVGIQTPG